MKLLSIKRTALVSVSDVLDHIRQHVPVQVEPLTVTYIVETYVEGGFATDLPLETLVSVYSAPFQGMREEHYGMCMTPLSPVNVSQAITAKGGTTDLSALLDTSIHLYKSLSELFSKRNTNFWTWMGATNGVARRLLEKTTRLLKRIVFCRNHVV